MGLPPDKYATATANEQELRRLYPTYTQLCLMRRTILDQIMHPAILPELRVIAGGLPVDDSCDLGAVDEDVVRKEVAVR